MSSVTLSAGVVLDWLASGRSVAAGLLTSVEGSTPLDPGAVMFVDADGHVEGSITGGCVESAVAHEALAILEGGRPPVRRRYGISDELAGTAGLMCGGVAHVFVSELGDTSRAAMRAALGAVVEQRPCAIATLLDGAAAGSRLMVDTEQKVGGLAGPPLLDQNIERDAP